MEQNNFRILIRMADDVWRDAEICVWSSYAWGSVANKISCNKRVGAARPGARLGGGSNFNLKLNYYSSVDVGSCNAIRKVASYPQYH